MRCDVVVVGGGPAGSTCAWKLRQAGLDVVVMDRAVFPREKPCAGWITPSVIETLELPLDEYRRQHTCQPITGFRMRQIGDDPIDVPFGSVVSYGICRSEFDHYLLQRSGARVLDGTAVHHFQRTGGRWIVNDAIESPLIVGAGGHFCPVARALRTSSARESPVIARETEVRMTPDETAACRVRPDVPELSFCEDLRGYGWAFRKGDVLNVGLGREEAHQLLRHVDEFIPTLDDSVASVAHRGRWHGHAYLLRGRSSRPPVEDGVVLVGDAAGLAHPMSGEGIRPAVESGVLGAEAILKANRRYGRRDLESYAAMLEARCPPPRPSLITALPHGWLLFAARPLFTVPWLTKHIVLERWFLQQQIRNAAA